MKIVYLEMTANISFCVVDDDDNMVDVIKFPMKISGLDRGVFADIPNVIMKLREELKIRANNNGIAITDGR